MENRRKYFKMPVISLAKQGENVKSLYPGFSYKISSEGKLICKGDIRPTSLSVTYTIKIIYKIGKRPVIKVINPMLDTSKGKIPHTYGNNELCVYMPKYKEWTKYQYIGEKVIPWISLWLYFYEAWLITGEWLGGGEHPRLTEGPKIKKLRRGL